MIHFTTGNKDYSVESLTDQGDGPMNEDQILKGDNIFGVFDGAGSINKYLIDGKTGGYIASLIAREIFAKNDHDLGALCLQANRTIGEEMLAKGLDITNRDNLWATTAAVVRLSDKHLEWLRIGDSLGLAVKKDGTVELLGDFLDHDLETMIEWKKRSGHGKSVQEVYDELRPMILDNRRNANVKYGFMNGDEDASKFVQSGSYELEDISQILLFTDGAFLPKEDPGVNYNWEDFFKVFQELGQAGFSDHIRRAEGSDQNCSKYPRFHPHDDLSIVHLSFE